MILTNITSLNIQISFVGPRNITVRCSKSYAGRFRFRFKLPTSHYHILRTHVVEYYYEQFKLEILKINMNLQYNNPRIRVDYYWI